MKNAWKLCYRYSLLYTTCLLLLITMWNNAKAIAYLIKTLLLYSNHNLIACILQAALQIQYHAVTRRRNRQITVCHRYARISQWLRIAVWCGWIRDSTHLWKIELWSRPLIFKRLKVNWTSDFTRAWSWRARAHPWENPRDGIRSSPEIKVSNVYICNALELNILRMSFKIELRKISRLQLVGN